MGELHARFSKNRLDEIARLVVQMRVSRIRHDAVEIVRNRADVFCDRPLIVVQHDDETLGVRFDVVERFVADPAGQCGVACYHDDVLIATAEIPSNRHTQACRERRPRMTGTVAIVFTFGA